MRNIPYQNCCLWSLRCPCHETHRDFRRAFAIRIPSLLPHTGRTPAARHALRKNAGTYPIRPAPDMPLCRIHPVFGCLPGNDPLCAAQVFPLPYFPNNSSIKFRLPYSRLFRLTAKCSHRRQQFHSPSGHPYKRPWANIYR